MTPITTRSMLLGLAFAAAIWLAQPGAARADDGDAAEAQAIEAPAVEAQAIEAQPVEAQPVEPGDENDQLSEAQREAKDRAFADRKAYLGVTVTAVDPTLGSHLDLPEGVGLVVEYVDPDGPAARAGIQQHDVLHKLNEQVLINPAQLRVLVRTFEPGSEVSLRCLRKATTQTVNATLAGRESIHRDNADAVAAVQNAYAGPLPNGGQRVPAKRSILFRDKAHQMRLTDDPAGRHLHVTDSTGSLVFDGYVDTEQDREALPEPIRRKLERVERLLRKKMQIQAGALQRIERQLADSPEADPADPEDRDHGDGPTDDASRSDASESPPTAD